MKVKDDTQSSNKDMQKSYNLAYKKNNNKTYSLKSMFENSRKP